MSNCGHNAGTVTIGQQTKNQKRKNRSEIARLERNNADSWAMAKPAICRRGRDSSKSPLGCLGGGLFSGCAGDLQENCDKWKPGNAITGQMRSVFATTAANSAHVTPLIISFAAQKYTAVLLIPSAGIAHSAIPADGIKSW